MDRRERLLVAYLLRGSAASEVDAFRRICQSSEIDRIAPHITLVPPVNVPTGLVDEVCASIEAASGTRSPIDLELRGMGVFPPGQRVIYLPVYGALDELVELRELCEVPSLRVHERHPFIAHVTIKSHADLDLAERLRPLLAHYSLPVTVDRVTVLRRDDSSAERVWKPVDEVMLGSALIIGRGGREIALSRASMVSHADMEFIVANRSSPILEYLSEHQDNRDTIVVRARVGGALAGVLVAQIHGEFCVLCEVVVEERLRRQGIGRQILSYLARGAEEIGFKEIVATVEEDGPAFLAGVGFEIAANSTKRDSRRRATLRVR